MEISSEGLELVKRSEGFRPRVYLDVAGIPTIGFGHKLADAESYPDGISEEQANTVLLWDVREAEQAVERLVKVPLTQGQFDALVDFALNLGEGRLASSTLLRELNAGHYDVAAKELLKWDHAASTELPALKTRREAERTLWLA